MKKEINALLAITKTLRERYNRRFTLDGKLVGDIGEALAQEKFNIQLLPENTEKYDAIEVGTNRRIQIKSTMKGYFTFPHGVAPEYYLAIKISEDGEIETIYNGPGHIIENYIKEKQLKSYRDSYYSFTLSIIKRLNDKVENHDRIIEKCH